jgi:hypothetical protein
MHSHPTSEAVLVTGASPGIGHGPGHPRQCYLGLGGYEGPR